MSGRTRLVLLAVGAIAVVAVVAVVAIVSSGGGSRSALTPPITVAPAVKRYPSPPSGAFVLAREDGTNVLALAVSAQAGRVALQASEINQNGAGAPGLHVSFDISSKARTAHSDAVACGPGCYRAAVALASRPLTVTVHVTRPAGTTRWKVALPARWPAQDGAAIVARASTVWRKLRSLRYTERLASDPKHAVGSDWQIVAPDRLAYQIQNEGQAVIVGLLRWDRQKGGAWVRSSSVRLHQPEPFWVEATDAHVVKTGRLRGHDVWYVSFYDPRTPGWFLAAIDRASYRTLDVHMYAAAHFMHDSYGSFNTSIKIDPPSSG
jgi:hypothetical protein